MDTKSDTLFGARSVKVMLLDGTEAEFKVRQLLLGEYPKARRFVDADDEIGLTAFICGHDAEWANNLTQQSYETLYAAALEVNKGFFDSVERQIGREERRQKAALQLVSQWTPDQLREAVQAGMQIKSTSPTGAPRPRP